jgi:GDP/UDP-N,N'-diacetylbacillosamine 2-epimerase (hydrolysing)
MRKVLAITGGRSDYFLLRPVYQAIMDHPGLELQLVVAGAHLSEQHGGTMQDVESDAYPIVGRIDNLIASDARVDRLRGLARQLMELTEIVDREEPDVLFVPMDREEAVTIALCGAYLHLPSVHYGAGDRVVGNVDDMVRHAVSRLCHVLLTTHEASRARLIQAGEESFRVHNVGSSGLDRLRLTPELSREELAAALGVEAVDDTYLVVVQHPLSSDVENSRAHMEETLAAALASGLQVFVSYPNSDAGSQAIIEVIEGYRGHARVEIFRNVPEIPFVNLLRMASALVGNSSMGLFEAPYLHLPAINAGARQTNRTQCENVFFVPSDRGAIAEMIDQVLNDDAMKQQVATCSQPFGDAQTGPRIAQLLVELELDTKLLNKDISY